MMVSHLHTHCADDAGDDARTVEGGDKKGPPSSSAPESCSTQEAMQGKS